MQDCPRLGVCAFQWRVIDVERYRCRQVRIQDQFAQSGFQIHVRFRLLH
jgi:hypothetical protein